MTANNRILRGSAFSESTWHTSMLRLEAIRTP